jgi:WD40 repeat protein
MPQDMAHQGQQGSQPRTQPQERKSPSIQDNDFSAPLTSFDWNPEFQNLIGTSSIDTTCTIWDIEKGTVFTQLIAHDKEVYDIHFSKERNIFASAGADGSVRQFDIRDLQHSSVQYETDRGRPILKLAWNRKEPSSTLLACIEMEANYVTLIDSRYCPPHPGSPSSPSCVSATTRTASTPWPGRRSRQSTCAPSATTRRPTSGT